MASLLPILQEILPMLMPGSVHITKAEELRRPAGLQHHSEDEADPSDQGDEDEEEEDEEDEEEEEEDRRASPTVWGPSAFPGDRRQRWQDRAQQAEQAEQKERAERAKKERRERAKERRERRERDRRAANGVSLRDAIVHKSGSLCASVLTVKPRCETVVFHNGEQEAIVYAVSGTAELATLPEDFDDHDHENENEIENDSEAGSLRSPAEPAKHTIGAGDFAFIPAWTEHQVRNTDDATDVVWVVVRNAGEPTVVPLESWGGEAK